MAITIVPKPNSELKLGAVNIRRARGGEPGQNGTVPQGRISVAVTLRRYDAGSTVDGQDLEPIAVSDMEAWITELATKNDPLTQEAIDKFTQVDDCLKWLTQLRGSELGLCDRPTA